MKAWKAELYLFLVTFIWGATFVFTKIGIIDCPPSIYIIFRFAIALILSLIFYGRHLFKIKKQTCIHGIILGLIFGGGFLLQTLGLKYTSVSKSGFITGISVVLTPFAYWLIERKGINFWQKAGVIIAVIGLWLFTNPRIDNINLGDLLTLISTVFWALYITYMDVFTRGRKSFAETSQIVTLQLLAATPIAIIYYYLFDRNAANINFSTSLLISLAFNGALVSFFVTSVHTSVQRYTTPVKAALIFSIEPLVASYIAVLFLHETLSGVEVFGAVILFLGVIASEFGEIIYSKFFNLKMQKRHIN